MNVLWKRGAESYAVDISPTTQVIGYSMNPLGRFRAFSWQNGVMTSLGTLGGDESLALAINATGQIVGQSEVHGGAIHAFLWTGRSMRDLGGPAAAYGINAAGMIVGARFINGNKYVRQPVFWENGVMTDLPTFGVEGEADALLAAAEKHLAQGDVEAGLILARLALALGDRREAMQAEALTDDCLSALLEGARESGS